MCRVIRTCCPHRCGAPRARIGERCREPVVVNRVGVSDLVVEREAVRVGGRDKRLYDAAVPIGFNASQRHVTDERVHVGSGTARYQRRKSFRSPK